MNIEDRLLRLERSNRYYKVALALCLCLFMVSAKDIFIKDEIHVKTLRAERILTNNFRVTNKIYQDELHNFKDQSTFYMIDSSLKYEYYYLNPFTGNYNGQGGYFE